MWAIWVHIMFFNGLFNGKTSHNSTINTVPSGNQMWLGYPHAKWRFLAGKILKLNGGSSMFD